MIIYVWDNREEIIYFQGRNLNYVIIQYISKVFWMISLTYEVWLLPDIFLSYLRANERFDSCINMMVLSITKK